MTRQRPTPHPFAPDHETPADPITGDQVCGRCHLVGRTGDAHHTMPPAVPDARGRAAGEQGDRSWE